MENNIHASPNLSHNIRDHLDPAPENSTSSLAGGVPEVSLRKIPFHTKGWSFKIKCEC